MEPSYATIDKVTVRDDGSGVDLNVTLQPSGQKTNARLGFAYEGAGFGLFVLPEVADEVLVVFTGGDINAGVVVARMPNKIDNLPAGVGSDKILLVGKSGHNLDVTINGNASFKVTGDTSINTTGKVDVTSGGNATIKASGNATVEATGTADVKAGGAATITSPSSIGLSAPNVSGGNGSSKALSTIDIMAIFNNHVHNGVEAGGSNSGAPTTPLATGNFTSQLKGA